MAPTRMGEQDIRTREDLLKLDTPVSPAERSSEKKRIRRHQVLDMIRDRGPLSRVEVARELSYNLPTVSSLVDELVRSGLVIEGEARPTRLGRRPIPVSLNANAACVMGIDSGRTNTSGLLMNLNGKVLHRMERPSPGFEDTMSRVQFLDIFAHDLISSVQDELPPLAGVGVAMPGHIREKGVHAPLTPHAEVIRKRLNESLGVPVLVENDARMMAMAVLWFEKERPLETFVSINIGTGLGMGVVIERRLVEGAFGHAGELGHLPLGEPNVPCYCGGNRCLENTASGSGIERLAIRHGIKNNGKKVTADEIFSLAREGSPEAQRVVNEFVKALALGISSVMNLINPQAIILGGRVSRSSELFLEALKEELEAHNMPSIYNETEIRVSNLSGNSTPFGACAYVFNHIFRASHVSLESVL